MRPSLYTERLEIRITDNMHDSLKREADLKELTVNQLIRNILEEYLS